MIANTISRLEYLCDSIPKLLSQLEESEFSKKVNPNKWSKKEILGHLIDSATNNHQRFVRGQFENKPFISYDQNKWNEFNFYQQIDTKQLINFWLAYNLQLLNVVKHIPEINLQRECLIGDKLYRLDFLIVDYVEHLEHHLKQIVDY